MERYVIVCPQQWEWGGGYIPYIFLEIDDENDTDMCDKREE